MRLILLGPPGAGKGTQANVLKEKLGVPTISTGAILRGAIAAQTELGKLADSLISKGNLVPDDVICSLVFERLGQADCENGYILDGFPRTIAQANVLDTSPFKVDRVLCILADDTEIVSRLSGRRECENCHATYHVDYNPPKKEGICDVCDNILVRRKDDDPETIKNRLAIYHIETKPLVAHYEAQGILVSVKSQEEIANTTKAVLSALGLA